MTSSQWHFDDDVVWHKSSNVIAGFGRKGVSIESLKSKFHPMLPKNSQWANLHQIHSDRVVKSQLDQQSNVEADAHFTFDVGLALIVKSADCLPVLLDGPASEQFPNGVVAAVHAGWRGVASDILVRTIEHLKSEGVDAGSLKAVIGPHIRSSSFEVGNDVAELLKAAARRVGLKESQSTFPVQLVDPVRLKSVVRLDDIARQQLIRSGLHPEAIEVFQEDGEAPDTKTNMKWASYRRDGANAGRNYSFIVRI